MRYIVLIPLAVFHSGAFNVSPFLPGCSLAWHPWQGCCSVYNTHLCLCSVCKFSKRNPKKSEAFCSLLCQIGATAGSRQPLLRWLVGHPRVPPPSPPLIPLRLVGEHQGTFWNFFLVTRLSLPFATLQSTFFSCFCMRSTFSIFKDLFTACFFSLTDKQL